MNSDQIGGILRIVIAGGFTLAAKKGWIPAMDKDVLSTDISALVMIGVMATWSHIRHAAPANIGAALFILWSLSGNDAYATDIAKAPAPIPACQSQISCTGPYVYAGIGGTGTNVDILGSGLSGSVFENGADVLAGGGYQLWNDKFFAAVEAGGGWLVPANSQAVSVHDRGYGEIEFKAGYGLQGLFSSATPTTFDKLAQNVISPYGILGVRFRSFGSGFLSGAGLQYYLDPKITLSVEYIHVSYNDAIVNGVSVHTDNGARFRLERHF